MIVMKYLHICGKRCSRSRKKSRRSRRQLAESPVCRAGRNERKRNTENQKTDKAINKNNAVGINISLGSTGWKDNRETATQEAKGSTITVGRTAAIIAKEDMTVKGSTVDAKDILLKAGNNIRILSSESKSTTIEDPKVKKE